MNSGIFVFWTFTKTTLKDSLWAGMIFEQWNERDNLQVGIH